MHEVEIYRGDDTSLIEALESAMGRFCVEVHVRSVPGPSAPAFGDKPISSVALTPIRAIKSEILNELRRVPDHLVKYAEGFIDGYPTNKISTSMKNKWVTTAFDRPQPATRRCDPVVIRPRLLTVVALDNDLDRA